MAEPRNPTTNETTQETADRMAGGSKSHPSSPDNAQLPSKPVGPSTHPTAKATYGSPIDSPILK